MQIVLFSTTELPSSSSSSWVVDKNVRISHQQFSMKRKKKREIVKLVKLNKNLIWVAAKLSLGASK